MNLPPATEKLFFWLVLESFLMYIQYSVYLKVAMLMVEVKWNILECALYPCVTSQDALSLGNKTKLLSVPILSVPNNKILSARALSFWRLLRLRWPCWEDFGSSGFIRFCILTRGYRLDTWEVDGFRTVEFGHLKTASESAGKQNIPFFDSIPYVNEVSLWSVCTFNHKPPKDNLNIGIRLLF